MPETKMAPRRRTGLISLNTEILLLSVIGIGTTLMETALFSFKENLLKVWDLDMSQFQISNANQHLLKSVICGIVIIRGLTSHIYLASYLLLLYPVIMERLRTMMLFWLMVAGLRSLAVNGAALVTGCVLCANHRYLAPTCFEFIAAKAAELACSAYMWVSVNDLYHQLKRHSPRIMPNEINLHDASGQERVEWSETSSSASEEWSLPQSFLAELGGETQRDVEISEGSEATASRSVDSVLAQAMVDWFCKKVLQLKKKGELPGGRPDMDSDKYKSLQTRIRKSIATIDPQSVNRGAALRWLAIRNIRSSGSYEREGRGAEDIMSVWSSKEQADESTRTSSIRRNLATDNALKDLLGIRPTKSDDWPNGGSVVFGGGSDSKLLRRVCRESESAVSSSTVDTAMQEVLSRLVAVLCQPGSDESFDLPIEASLHNMHSYQSEGRVSKMIWHELPLKKSSQPLTPPPPISSPVNSPEVSLQTSPLIPATPTSTPASPSTASISQRTVDASVQTLPPSSALLRKLDYATEWFTNQ